MNPRASLFVGGPANGRRIYIPEGETIVKMPSEEGVIDYIEWRIGGDKLRLFATARMSFSDVAAMLCDKYPEP